MKPLRHNGQHGCRLRNRRAGGIRIVCVDNHQLRRIPLRMTRNDRRR
jgi:hypothetical protein